MFENYSRTIHFRFFPSHRSGRAFVFVFSLDNLSSFHEVISLWDMVQKIRGKYQFDTIECHQFLSSLSLTLSLDNYDGDRRKESNFRERKKERKERREESLGIVRFLYQESKEKSNNIHSVLPFDSLSLSLSAIYSLSSSFSRIFSSPSFEVVFSQSETGFNFEHIKLVDFLSVKSGEMSRI